MGNNCLPDPSDSAVPAHQEEDKSNNTENADDDGQTSKNFKYKPKTTCLSVHLTITHWPFLTISIL